MDGPTDSLPRFFAYLQFEKRYSPHTLAAYRADLEAFFQYLHQEFGDTPLSSITHHFVRSWLAQLKDQGLTAKSINRKLSSLTSFFKYGVKMGLLAQSPMAKVMAPKTEKRLPEFVAEKDLQTLFTHVSFSDDWKGLTDRLLLTLFYQSGMRLSEALRLRESDVNASNHTVKVLGKGSKERVIPIGAPLAAELLAYCRQKATALEGPSAGRLFVTSKGRPLQPRAVYAAVKSYLSLVTTISQRSPHVLRHSFATHLLNNGAELNAVKELLGHSSLAATQVYTHNTIEKLKNVHQKAHPKA